MVVRSEGDGEGEMGENEQMKEERTRKRWRGGKEREDVGEWRYIGSCGLDVDAVVLTHPNTKSCVSVDVAQQVLLSSMLTYKAMYNQSNNRNL